MRDANAVVTYLLALGSAKPTVGLAVDEWLAWESASLSAAAAAVAATAPTAVAEAVAAAGSAPAAALEKTVSS